MNSRLFCEKLSSCSLMKRLQIVSQCFLSPVSVVGLDLSEGEDETDEQLDELIDQYAPREVVELRFGDSAKDEIALQLEGLAARTEVLADRILLYTDNADDTQRGLHERGINPEQVLVRRSTLEDVFLRLTGRRLID